MNDVSVVMLGNNILAVNTEMPVRFLKTLEVYFEEKLKHFF